MEIFIEKNYDEQCRQVANAIEQYCKEIKYPVFCPASGDTPKGVYDCLVKDGKNGYSFDHWKFVGLDEWVGFNREDQGSCQFHLNEQLFQPLNIAADNICFFNGRAENLDLECDRVEKLIGKHGGIDIALLGLGSNGHVGMNEPGSDPLLQSHVVELHTSTTATAQKYFNSQTALKKGITLGLGSLMKVKKIILMVSGPHKAEIVAKILNAEPTNELPATLLKSHPNLTVWLDADAASAINNFLEKIPFFNT